MVFNVKKLFLLAIQFSALLLLTCILSLPIKTHAKDKITWYVAQWAPYNITRGKLKRKGINDKLIKHIHQFLPNYDMTWKNMNPVLLNKAFAKGDNICQLDLFKTPEREKIAYFTQFPAIIDAPLRLFVKGRNRDKMNLLPPVDIQALLSNEQYKGSFVTGRSYSAEMDDIIEANIGSRIKTNESTKRVIKDFFKGKSDFVIEYSAVMSYFKSVLKNKQEILSLPIKGTKAYVLGYTACSKTLWGKTVIEEINKVLKDQRHSERYKGILEQWHDERSKQLIVDNYFYF